MGMQRCYRRPCIVRRARNVIDLFDFFVEFLSDIDTVNRCYLWRILFDHVTLLKLSPAEFIGAVITHILNEPEG